MFTGSKREKEKGSDTIAGESSGLMGRNKNDQVIQMESLKLSEATGISGQQLNP